MVLHQGHLGYQIGGGDQLRLGIAAGHDDVQTRAACDQGGDDHTKIELETPMYDALYAWCQRQTA